MYFTIVHSTMFMYYRARRIIIMIEDVQVYKIMYTYLCTGQADNNDEGGCTGVYCYVQMFM